VTVVCSPEPGGFFPVGTTTVTCSATDACGETGRGAFAVSVRSPFGPSSVCVADDVSGDAFSLVVAPGHPLDGAWFYHVAATGADLSGRAVVRDVPGRALTATDDGRSDANHTFAMKMKLRHRTRRATASVSRLDGGERHALRDADAATDPPCP
jgi:hypothetical protein